MNTTPRFVTRFGLARGREQLKRKAKLLKQDGFKLIRVTQHPEDPELREMVATKFSSDCQSSKVLAVQPE